MNISSLPQSLLTAALAVGLLVGVAGLSYGVLEVLGADLKWLVYMIIAGLAVFVFAMISDKQRFLWVVLVLAFQIDVYFRLFYGRSGTPGLMFSFPFLVGLATMAWYLAPATDAKLRQFNLGGPMAMPALCLLGVSMLSAVFSTEKFFGLVLNFWYVQFYFFFLLAYNLIDSTKKLELTIKLLLVILTIQSLVYFIQVSLGVTFTLAGEVIDATGRSSSAPRPGGTVATNPAGFSSFVLPLICIATALFFWMKMRLGTFLWSGLPAILGLCALLLTLTRAAWGSAIVGLGVVVWISYKRGMLSQSKLMAIFGAGVVVVLAAIPLVVSRLAEAPLDDSFDERITLMKMSFEMIKANPILGVGPFAYRETLTGYLPYELLTAWRAVVHNHYLLRTAETGLLGGIAFLAVLITAFRQAVDVSRSGNQFYRVVGIGLLGALAALCFEMFWDMFSGYTYNALLWFLLGVLGATQRLDSEASKPPEST